MRVLLALDGSVNADRARALAASIDWPGGSVIEVLAVVQAVPAFGYADVDGAGIDEVRQDLDRIVSDARASLERDGTVVRSTVLVGRPASLIVDEAMSFRPDLVIVGSRGFGLISSMVLGSVSAEVVDRSPCPVLVARAERIGSLLVGVDGSETAQVALDYLAGFRPFAGTPATVVSVVPLRVPILDPLGYVGYAGYDRPQERSVQHLDPAFAEHRGFVDAAVRDLRQAGYTVSGDVRQGDPAHALIELSKTSREPVVVLGTHGRTGLIRAVLGSTARNVLLHATCSVLVVRGPVRERSGESLRAASATGRLVGGRGSRVSALGLT